MNISEILKYFPKGTKLYSPIWGEVEFIEVASSNNIVIKSPDGNEVLFYCSGAYHRNGECVLFPSKDQRDWKELKIGDIIIEKNSKYRPFKDIEECRSEMQKHQPFGWIKNGGYWYNIINTDGMNVKIIDTLGAIATLYFSDILAHYRFADGTPLGIREEV